MPFGTCITTASVLTSRPPTTPWRRSWRSLFASCERAATTNTSSRRHVAVWLSSRKELRVSPSAFEGLNRSVPPPLLPPRSSGSHFYRYQTTEHLERLEPVILEHKLYIPLASTFNDLRDAHPRLEEKTAGEWAAYLRSRVPH